MNWLDRIFHVGPSIEKMPLKFYNTLGKTLQEFKLRPGVAAVRMYNCGPTVYDRQHIGNLSAAVFADTIRRVLELNGYAVKQVINITDFGHLSSDADEGEDKMTKGLKREKLTLTMEHMHELAAKYMNVYLEDIRTLNVAVEKIKFPRASHYVPTMIAMIQTLEEKGYAYQIKDGVYFDTAKFTDYGRLGGISLEGQQEGARVEANTEKRSPQDFVLWKSISARSKIGWKSPWGKGFPGWHLECSAMIHDLLGKQIDIHTGGIEHISIHHNNEIAQSEAVTGKKPLSRFWLHREHILMGNMKLAKSTGNTAYLSDVIEKGIHPLSLRYWFLTAHYRQPANFSWEAVEAAQKAYLRLRGKLLAVKDVAIEKPASKFLDKFMERVNDDLDTAGAIASVWESLNSGDLTPGEQQAVLEMADHVLGLGLSFSDELLVKLTTSSSEIPSESLPADVRDLFVLREDARKNKEWEASDKLRSQIEESGYTLKDAADGAKIYKK